MATQVIASLLLLENGLKENENYFELPGGSSYRESTVAYFYCEENKLLNIASIVGRNWSRAKATKFASFLPATENHQQSFSSTQAAG